MTEQARIADKKNNNEELPVSEIARILNRDRKDLLDLTYHNRLLNVPRRQARSKTLEIIDEKSDEIFRILVEEGKTMYFRPIPKPEEDKQEDGYESKEEDKNKRETIFYDLPQPENEELDERGRAARHIDTFLQTPHLSERLQKRLLSLYFDARTYQEEQGVNVLYLAIGLLKLYEDNNSDKERWAPLVLIPVSLARDSVGDRFKLTYNEEDITTNLSLKEKLRNDFGLELPDLGDSNNLTPSNYFDSVRKTISNKHRWEVHDDDMVLGFFSFSKFLMYRDLDPENWPDSSLEDHEIINSLLLDGFPEQDPLFGEDDKLDQHLLPQDTFHVVDCDSSQSKAIEEVRKGGNLVIQGPPGTGKSQTITNLIASAVQDGKTVLFLAEKMAALEVVKRRLEGIGLGDLCLELHSHKANKKQVLADLANTLALGPPVVLKADKSAKDLLRVRDDLNEYVEKLHTPVKPSFLTPYRLLGVLVKTSSLGLTRLDMEFPQGLEWTYDEIQERTEELAIFSQAIQQVGIPVEFAWRGVGMEVALPDDLTKITQQTKELIQDIVEHIDNCLALANELMRNAELNINECYEIVEITKLITQSPEFDYMALKSKVWESNANEIEETITLGLTYAENKEKVDAVFSEIAWDANLVEARIGLAANADSFLKFLTPQYWKAKSFLKGIMKTAYPDTDKEAIENIDTLMSAQKQKALLKDQQTLGREAFGAYWKNEDSDWNKLQEVYNWNKTAHSYYENADYLDVVNKREAFEELRQSSKSIERDTEKILGKITRLFDFIKLDTQEAFETESINAVPMVRFLDRLKCWLQDPEGITKWIAFQNSWKSINSLGLEELPQRAYDGEIEPSQLHFQFKHILYTQIFRSFAHTNPEFGTFDGSLHMQKLKLFCDLDKKRIDIARSIVAATHYEGIPKGHQSIGGLGTIKGEIQKKRRHLPVRKLLAQAGQAVQAIKPVFMMSPMSVAQYLEPGKLTCDLLLIDEASQVQPIDALGAIARSKQIVVVGDSKQLPPTKFFSVSNDDLDEDEDTQSAGDMESILGLCEAKGIHNKMLRWHYRSRHHSLITPSNHLFYDDRLFIVPSPYPPNQNLGMHFEKVDGIYDRGKTATNRTEAKAVAEACIEHARKFPHLTLGVGSFSVRQQRAIQDELEFLYRQNPDVHAFFNDSGTEPFFVKNLENIQGDERDVIFLSIGYAKDKSGYMAMNFGPLSKDGGQRRLNVLITRAKQKCVVYSSITADDIDLARTQSKGVHALKVFLTYAQTGKLPIAQATGKDFDSEFEVQVANALVQYGYEVEPQLGIAGFFIDLAVKDPENPARYLLGVECDGAAYHSSRSARDRDRLRQQVLEDHGWIIHRIWSTDWFYRPEDEIRKLMAALEKAKKKNEPKAKIEQDGKHIIERETAEIFQEDKDVWYREASFHVNTSQNPHEITAGKLTDIVIKVVEIEGPIHKEEVSRRIADLWGFQKAGSRIVRSVNDALRRSQKRDPVVIEIEGDFCSHVNTKYELRNRSRVASASLKKVPSIPPAEIKVGIKKAAEEYVGISRDDAVLYVSRKLGFQKASAQLRELIIKCIVELLNVGDLEEQDGKLVTLY